MKQLLTDAFNQGCVLVVKTSDGLAFQGSVTKLFDGPYAGIVEFTETRFEGGQPAYIAIQHITFIRYV